MRKLDKEKLEELINLEVESAYIDFKVKQYGKDKKEDLLKDVISMANSEIDADKYIIIGVKYIPGQKNKLIGIDEDIRDDSEYQQLIYENIEPTIKFSYLSDEIQGKKIAYFHIDKNNIDRPYMIKKDNKNLKQGDAFKRVGSSQRKLIRRDYDEIYKNNKRELLMLEKIKAYKNEILLIEKLKRENEYLISKNYEIIKDINSYNYCVKSPRYFIREILPYLEEKTSENLWKYKCYKKFIGFSIKDLDIDAINRLLENLEGENICKYIDIVSNLEDGYKYMNKLERELSELKNFDFFKDEFKVDSKVASLNLRNINDNFGIKIYFSSNSSINVDDRIKELKDYINKLEE